MPPWAARALSPSATKPPYGVLALAGDDPYRFRPPGGEAASTALPDGG